MDSAAVANGKVGDAVIVWEAWQEVRNKKTSNPRAAFRTSLVKSNSAMTGTSITLNPGLSSRMACDRLMRILRRVILTATPWRRLA